jgi:N-acetylmuramoyl-L-alanine amidase
MNRSIDKLIIHCTGTLKDVPAWIIIKNFKDWNHWDKPGYHFLIDHLGKVHSLLSVSEVSNGARGFNDHSVNIAYIGGIDGKGFFQDTRTELQKISMLAVLTVLHNLFKYAKICGHSSLPGVDKACPCMFYNQEYIDLMKP